jgi:hypothetical protein
MVALSARLAPGDVLLVVILLPVGWLAGQGRPERAPSPVRAPIAGRRPGRRVAVGEWLSGVAEVVRDCGFAALPAVVPAVARDLTGCASMCQACSPTQFRAIQPDYSARLFSPAAPRRRSWDSTAAQLRPDRGSSE